MKFRIEFCIIAPVLTVLCVYIMGMAGCSVRSADTSPSPESLPLTIEIDSPNDGTIFKTNLVEVSGVVSRPEASVVVSGREATVAYDGSFYAYLDLAKGENIIEAIAISGGGMAMASVKVTYSPAVAVYLGGSGQEIHQPTGEITITAMGHVIPVEASVKVNGVPVEVSKDGSFSTSIQLREGNNIIRAAASYEGDEDNHSFTLILEDGQVIPPPGQGMMYLSRFSHEESVEMKAGGEVHLGVVGDIRKDMPDPAMLTCEIYPVAGEYSKTKVLPEGMEVTIEPSRFTVHPNTIYHLNINIKTTSDTPPGEYYLYFPKYCNGNRFMGGWIKLDVKS